MVSREKIHIYIGTEPDFWLPTEVLRYSILSRTKADIEFTEIKEVPSKKNLSLYSGLKRFFVPQLNGYKTRSIYLNSGSLVLSDIEELFNLDMKDKAALARSKNLGVKGYYTGVMLLDCPRLKWSGDEMLDKVGNHDQYNKTVWGMEGGLFSSDLGPLPDNFNHFDTYDSTTKILMYSDLHSAPWKNRNHPQSQLFIDELKRGLADKEIPPTALQREIEKQIVFPDILN